MQEPILTSFMDDKIKNYIEPTREGTPRGEQIGFSRAKYKAAVLCLTNSPIKKIAEVCDVSYGLLRKWRTEEGFIEQINQLADEFANLFYKEIKSISLSKEPDKPISPKSFRDVESWGDYILKSIDNNYIKAASTYDLNQIAITNKILEWIYNIHGVSNQRAFQQLEQLIDIVSVRNNLNHVYNKISAKGNFSDDEIQEMKDCITISISKINGLLDEHAKVMATDVTDFFKIKSDG